MFINCPHCQALIATDPATDRPPERCPRCDAVLREQATPVEATASASGVPATQAEPREGSGTAVLKTDAGIATAGDPETYETNSIEPDRLHESADAIAETVLGPAAVEVEIASADDTPGDASIDTAADPHRKPMPTNAAAPDASSTQTTHRQPLPAAAKPAPVRAKSAPSFARTRSETAVAPRLPQWKPIAAVVALTWLLVLQLLLADRAQLAADARWRPLLTTICGVLRCDLPAWHEPAAFTLLSRDVRPHPTVAGALRVSASFRNDARWPQPWPRLQLTLSDVDGRAAGTRSFAAREYLGDAPTQNELASGQSATVAMDILEPAPNIVAFDFDFR